MSELPFILRTLPAEWIRAYFDGLPEGIRFAPEALSGEPCLELFTSEGQYLGVVFPPVDHARAWNWVDPAGLIVASFEPSK